jgi:hypothetical protein
VKELQDNGVDCSKMGEQMFTMKSNVAGQPSVLSDELDQSVEQKICERWCFTISELSCEFLQFHALLSTRLSQLGYAITSFPQDGF